MPMRHVTFRFILFFCALIIAGLAGFPKPLTASGISNQMYLSLVERAKTQTDNFDFSVLRGAYEKSDFYDPSTHPGKDLPLILEQVDKNEPGAADYLHNYIGNNFALPEVHMVLLSWYEKKGNKEKAAYHTWLANGLLNVIIKYADGQGQMSPYYILSRGEISIVMEMKQIPVAATRQWPTSDGHLYEIIKGRNPATGQVEEVWFDVTPMQSKSMAQ